MLASFFILLLAGLVAQLAIAIELPESYNVVWTSQSRNSSESMPLGGGGIGANVWVENSTVLLYISKNGLFDDNNSLVKLGRVRLTLEPNPFTSHFSQTLHLNDGYIQIKGRNSATVKLWVDVFNPAVHVEMDSATPISVVAAYESWRYRDRAMDSNEQDQSDWDVFPDLDPAPVTKADNISFYDGGVRMIHRNTENTTLDVTFKEQGLEDHIHEAYNPLAHNTYGMWMYCPDLRPNNISSGFYVNTDYKSWNLVSTSPKTSYKVVIVAQQAQSPSLSNFQSALQSTISRSINQSQALTASWWHNFWDRSYILINEEAGPEDTGFVVGKNYQIFRYMQGCNWGSDWPLRFNGGLFTFDPVFVNENYSYTPDFRRWTGGVFTAQNQRLVYWPLLKSGDFDLMKPTFEFYRRITGTAMLRGRTYFGLNVSVFTEQVESYGLPNMLEYNTDVEFYSHPRNPGFPRGIEFNSWLEWLQDTANEFADMILQANMYSGFDVTPYMAFIESQLRWYDLFYQQFHSTVDTFSRAAEPLNLSSSGNGPLVIYPGSGQETYKCAYNPASTVSGLRKVLSDLLQVAPTYAIANRSYYEGYLQRVPETPIRYQQGHICISPAQAYTRIQNVEIPQLYPVFPWGEYGLGQPNLQTAINTYLYDTETQAFHDPDVGWKQDPIWFARMGLVANATNSTIYRWADSDVYRFPVFKGPNFDWAPDINHFGSASIALQEMLLQTFAKNNTQIRLLGAWPDEWDVKFKLLAPMNTTVIGTVSRGKFDQLDLAPSNRMSDVVYKQD
ncbi:hypothetical protein NA57DRAFT_46676 [Rhizodiscina lignyota]|uniref:DUF5703 domain-containing protein n=1 Tax=Rhizodiscina lignyota TaxID=1504668 RepID=A0A9P4IA97_9PEZI|nr:hypothetical protein NA57DRAFT_46676 [Rhizodiscina lignyota]